MTSQPNDNDFCLSCGHPQSVHLGETGKCCWRHCQHNCQQFKPKPNEDGTYDLHKEAHTDLVERAKQKEGSPVDLTSDNHKAVIADAAKMFETTEETKVAKDLYDCEVLGKYCSIHGHVALQQKINSLTATIAMLRGALEKAYPICTCRNLNEIIIVHGNNCSFTLHNKALNSTPPSAIAYQQKFERMEKALKELSCLGNGDKQGNSKGNIIAQEALTQ